MNISSGYLKKMGYLLFTFFITVFWGCGGRNLPGGGEDVAGKDNLDRCIPDCNNKDCVDDGCRGSCGNSCGANANCSNSSCACTSGYANCDNDWSNGCEVNLNSIYSCGMSCSNRAVCSSTNGTDPVCDNGICKLTCNSGYADCNVGVGNTDGCEKQLDLNYLWSKSFGVIGNDYGNSVSVDSLGNVYITGYFDSSTIDFGGGELKNAGRGDIFLAKFDSNGNHIWSKSFGVGEWDKSNSVSVDSLGNVYGIGYFYGSNIDFGGCPLSSAGRQDIYLIKYAP